MGTETKARRWTQARPQRKIGPQSRAVAGCGAQCQFSAERVEPVFHVQEAGTSGLGPGVETDAVVLDLEAQAAVVLAQPECGCRRSGVFLDVLHGLQAAEVDRGFDVL